MGTPASDLLRLIPGLEVIDSNVTCCGIAGTYGLKKEKYDIAQAVGKPLFDMVKANNDGLAFCALTALRRFGLRVPEDVAVVGMGDLPRGDDTGAGLSSVREPCEEIGRLAAETLLGTLAKTPSPGTVAPSGQISVPGVELRIRRSTIGIQEANKTPIS